ncbi:hypothetical protein K438DRAFT_1786459 [Mycena galopus ATCC 62051]|nr:hypothetical protein K438DRAFT_1786459 [Mycena galopus ATCC 62051]
MHLGGSLEECEEITWECLVELSEDEVVRKVLHLRRRFYFGAWLAIHIRIWRPKKKLCESKSAEKAGETLTSTQQHPGRTEPELLEDPGTLGASGGKNTRDVARPHGNGFVLDKGKVAEVAGVVEKGRPDV